jgi:hypothetical protein
MAKSNATDNTTTPEVPALKSHQTFNQATGEIGSKFKYLEGHPRQYRFDAKEGTFAINGTEKLGPVLSFQPFAWRIFVDDILKMGKKTWAELFFIDEKGCVSVVMFHGYSVDNIFRLIEPLYYDDQTLADIVLTVVAEKKENTKIQPKGVYYIANFSYKLAKDADRTALLKEFGQDTRIFRQETLTDLADIRTAYNFYNPHANGEETEALPEGTTQQQVNEAVEQHYADQAEQTEQ